MTLDEFRKPYTENTFVRFTDGSGLYVEAGFTIEETLEMMVARDKHIAVHALIDKEEDVTDLLKENGHI